MSSVFSLEREQASALCNACGIPLDSQYFDDSSVQPISVNPGEEVVLARFDLPPQYCGVLQYFSQFTDAFGEKASKIATPDIEWRLLVNGHGLFPYMNLRRIVNPWGEGSYPLNIRLDESSTLELVARRVVDDGALKNSAAVGTVAVVGGRIAGRFWYDASYGDVI
jgi:hypothetical protein